MKDLKTSPLEDAVREAPADPVLSVAEIRRLMTECVLDDANRIPHAGLAARLSALCERAEHRVERRRAALLVQPEEK